MPTLPDIAWEQALYVCLFIVFVVVILRWFGQQQKNRDSFNTERDAKAQAHDSALAKQWQEFISDRDQQFLASIKGRDQQLLISVKERDESWQRWIATHDTQTAKALEQVASTLKELSDRFSEHDDLTREGIATMKERTANRRKPAAKG